MPPSVPAHAGRQNASTGCQSAEGRGPTSPPRETPHRGVSMRTWLQRQQPSAKRSLPQPDFGPYDAFCRLTPIGLVRGVALRHALPFFVPRLAVPSATRGLPSTPAAMRRSRRPGKAPGLRQKCLPRLSRLAFSSFRRKPESSHQPPVSSPESRIANPDRYNQILCLS